MKLAKGLWFAGMFTHGCNDLHHGNWAGLLIFVAACFLAL